MGRSRNSVQSVVLSALASALVLFFPSSNVQAGGLAESYSATYLAPASVLPCGIWRMRTPEGAIRQFESVGDGSWRLKSADGWRAEIASAEKVTVMSPEGGTPALKVVYDNGRPSFAEIDGKAVPLVATDAVSYAGETMQPYRWPDWWERDFRSDQGLRSLDPRTWWWESRFTLWFVQPNQGGAFFAMLFALAVVPALRARKRRLKAVSALLALLSFVGILLTQSRSSLIAAAVAAGLVSACHLRSRGWLTRRRIGIAIAAFAVCCAVAGAVFAGFSSVDGKLRSQSDSYRVMMCRAFPRMMCDAPWGWGTNQSGRAFSDWYCPEDHLLYRKNLVSDHLTTLADFGWLGGGAYLLAWLVGLLGLFVLAWRGGTPVPLAVWSALAVASSFNVILSARTMLWLPLLALVPLAFDRRWLDWRFWMRPALIGGLATLAALAAVLAMGVNTTFAPSVRRDGNAVLVNGERPQIWLVADSDALGSSVMPREEVRGFYRVNPKAPAVGIVGDLDHLGRTNVRRLVLSGRHCEEFLRRHRADSFRRGIPPEIVFLSPGFSARAVPPELMARAKVSVVTGEFAARYHADMDSPPQWATVVKGAELYIPGWMRYFVPAGGRETGR